MKKIYRLSLGWVFIVLGVLGLFLPFLQGILFLFIGAIILAPEVPFFHTQLSKLEKRYPGISERAKGMLKRISRFWSKETKESHKPIL